MKLLVLTSARVNPSIASLPKVIFKLNSHFLLFTESLQSVNTFRYSLTISTLFPFSHPKQNPPSIETTTPTLKA
jgi:hypothetical protein